jgi:4-amino-4-deoxy-L-arabinose transferase-like glycosyltransferase
VATVTAPRPGVPRVADIREPNWFSRIPAWLQAIGILLVLLAISAYLRTRFISGQFWMDEAITTGIASHPLSAIPGILRHDGNPPLFYMLLHGWMSVFGSSESATHSLSILFGLLTVPVGMWAGWSLFGRRAGVMAAILFTFNAWLTYYAGETRMYELMALLGIIATASFLHAFVYRRRRYLIVFAAMLALMLYTHSWGVFFFLGALIALIPAWFVSDDRRGLVRDAAFAFVGAGVLYLPWVPNLLYQASHTAAPWSRAPKFGAPVLISHQTLGGDRVTAALLVGSVAGLAGLFTRQMRRTREATVLWTLIVLAVATLVVAWVSSQANPAFVPRYFAPVVASILLIAAMGCARAGLLGLLALALSAVFLLNPGAVAPSTKSDMRYLSGQISPLVHRGDLVVVGQPEQTSLAWYYLPTGLRYANTIGPVSDPSYMNWVDALHRLEHANPQATLAPLVASLRPGQQLLYVRPLTEGEQDWNAPWTQLVRRRSAQWGALLQADVNAGVLREVAAAPEIYVHACCVADSAVLYEKR